MGCAKEKAPLIWKDEDWEFLYADLEKRMTLPLLTVDIDLDAWAGFIDRKRSRYEPDSDNHKVDEEVSRGEAAGPGTKKPRIGDFDLETQERGLHAQRITAENWCGTHGMVCFKRNGGCLAITNARMKLWTMGCVDGTADYKHPPNTKDFDADFVLQSQGLTSEIPTLKGRAKATTALAAPVINIHVPPQPSPSAELEKVFGWASSFKQMQGQMRTLPYRPTSISPPLFSRLEGSPKARCQTPPWMRAVTPPSPVPSPEPKIDLPRLTTSPIPPRREMVAVALNIFGKEHNVDVRRAIAALGGTGFLPEDVRQGQGFTIEWFEHITGLPYGIAKKLRRFLIDYAATTRFKIEWGGVKRPDELV